ncbi:TonB-dependent siderophore receptor [Flavobacterium sp. Sd200]|nr:TonB-dependent siderophore receptor [Flavobacterium sp. Sd200]
MSTTTFKKLLLSLMLLFGATLWAQERASLSGTVTLSDNTAAENISVALKGTNYGAVTNTQGNFEIKNIKPGSYVLRITAVGIKTVEEQITLASGEKATKNVTLSENQEQLNEVVINGNKNKYKTDKPSTTLRLDAPVLEIPQNIQIVSNQTLQDQQIISMSDGLIRNVSGAVRLEHWGDLYANITMRGSQIQAFRNGFNVVSSFWGPLTEDMSFVDHIEFVKGPAGFMISSGDPSGLYNVVTKKPTGQTKGEASMTLGSFDLFRTTLDLDGKLSEDGKLLYRLNVSAQNKGSHRPYEHNDRYVIAPVVSYQFDDRTKLTFEYNYQRANMTEVGSYYVYGPHYASLSRDFTLTQPGIPDTKINDHSFYAMFEHNIDDNWKVTAQASYFKYLQEGYSSWPTAVGPGPVDVNWDGAADFTLGNGEIIRNVGVWDAESTMKLGQAFVNGKFQTGPVSHKILAGLDLGSKDYMADWGQSHDLDTPDNPFNVFNPTYGAPVNGYPVFDRSRPLAERAAAIGGLMNSRYSAGYLQDELGFFENKLRLTLAGRYTYVSQASWGGAPISDKHITPRVGLSYTIDEHTSAYALYDQAFTPQGGVMSNGSAPKPLTGNNREIGVKRDWFDGKWSTTLSAYSILKKNETMSDPNNPTQFVIVFGERRAEGIEFDARGEIIPGLNLIANYAFTESTVTKVNNPDLGINVGDIVPGYAKHTANAWLTYAIQNGKLKGLGASAGFTFLGDRETDTWSPGAERLPDYFKLDGGLSYERGKVKFTANMFNILNKYLYSGSSYGTNLDGTSIYYWQSEPPRNVRLGITYKF